MHLARSSTFGFALLPPQSGVYIPHLFLALRVCLHCVILPELHLPLSIPFLITKNTEHLYMAITFVETLVNYNVFRAGRTKNNVPGRDYRYNKNNN